MTILILFALFLTALVVDYFVQLRQARIQPVAQVKPVALQSYILPDGVFSAPGHVWSILMPSGRMRMGIDPLVARMLGKIDQVTTPEKGNAIQAGQPLFKVVQGEKSITIPSPVSGIIEEVNPLVMENGEVVKRDVHKAWTVAVKPQSVTESLKQMKLGEEARHWISTEMNRLRDFFALRSAQPELALAMQDGGMPVEGIMQTMDQETWKQFEQEFLSTK